MKENVEGYVKTHRKIKQCSFYTDAVTMLLFQHILLESAWVSNKEEERGELKTSISELAIDLKKDRKTIRKSLNILMGEKVITVRKEGKNYIIKVVNYPQYQGM